MRLAFIQHLRAQTQRLHRRLGGRHWFPHVPLALLLGLGGVWILNARFGGDWSQYAQALANYKGVLNDYYVLKDNLQLAQEVFNTIDLQYRSGIKAYLDLITAQTDLRTAESNYSNALYQVLSSKLDVEKAMGTVQY